VKDPNPRRGAPRRPIPPARPTAPAVRGTLPRSVVEDVRSAAKRGTADRVLGLLERAVAAMERGRPGEAVERASDAKRMAGRSAAVREILGIALYQAERFREALRELQAYRRISGRADHNHLVADCHRALGAPDKVIPLAQEALTAPIPEEARAEAVVVAAAALADDGRYDEAVGILRRFRTDPGTARPYDLRLWYVLGDVLERAGRREEAMEAFRRILRHEPDAFDAAERLAALS
jgi:tetratricopeptide (TPR) repeat protein